MHNVIFYNPAMLVPAEEGAAHATVDDIRATAKALSKSGTAHFLRDVVQFDGFLERVGDELPGAVLFLGTSGFDLPDHVAAKFDAVGQAFEEVEVEVRTVDLHSAEDEGEEADGEEDDADAELAALKAKATELGINFNPNIKAETLAKRIAVEEEAAAKADAAKEEGKE